MGGKKVVYKDKKDKITLLSLSVLIGMPFAIHCPLEFGNRQRQTQSFKKYKSYLFSCADFTHLISVRQICVETLKHLDSSPKFISLTFFLD